MTELAASKKVVGVKQSRKAIRDGAAAQVFLAADADPAITEPLADACAQQGVSVFRKATMAQLGRACHITVGASVVAVLK